MATDHMSLIELLRGRELWREIIEIMDERRRFPNYNQGSLLQRDVSNRVFEDDKIRSTFQNRVVNLLVQPSPITADELAENIRQQLIGVPFDSESGQNAFRQAVERFVELSTAEWVDNQYPRHEGDAEIPLGHWAVNDTADEDKLIRFEAIWESEDFELDAVAAPSHVEPDFSGYNCKLVGRLVAYCSHSALVAAERWFSRYAPSIAKTVACCTTREERDDSVLINIDDLLGISDSTAGIPPDKPSLVSFLTSKEQFGNKVFAACLDAVGRRHLQGNDAFTQRLANSVHLLAEADRTDSVPVALTLCFAAIEAMLCDKPENVKVLSQAPDKDNVRTDTTVQIKKYIPALLMPSHIGRSKRGAELYALYVARCDTIHGRKIAGHSLALQDIRQIAAGVIRSSISWRETRAQGQKPSNWEDLFEEINRAAFENTDMSDVPDLSNLLPGARRTNQYR